ncbi:hypothetical protein AVEN_28267-1, partial [Araneus ventricosus]
MYHPSNGSPRTANTWGRCAPEGTEHSENTSLPCKDNVSCERDSAANHDQDLLTLNPTEEETRELEGATPLNELRELFPLAKWRPDIPAGNPTIIIQQAQSEDPNTFCTDCNIELNEEDAYARHRMRVHGDLSSSAPFNPVYMCHACSQSFSTLQGKRSHNCPKSKPSKFKCNTCMRDCRSGKGVREHQQRVHHIFPNRRIRLVPDSQRGPDDLPLAQNEVQNEETHSNNNIVNHRTVTVHSEDPEEIEVTLENNENQSDSYGILDPNLSWTEIVARIWTGGDNENVANDNRGTNENNIDDPRPGTSRQTDSNTRRVIHNNQDSCPPITTRYDDCLHIPFPISDPLYCTEEGCSTFYSTQSWLSNKGNLIKHLCV